MKHTGILCNESKYQETPTQSHHAYHVCKSLIDHAGVHCCAKCGFVWGIKKYDAAEKQKISKRAILHLPDK